MRTGRTETAGHTASGEGTGKESAGRAGRRAGGRMTAARGPWAVIGAVVTVVLGPAAVTASALDRANAAPMRHTPAHRTVRAEPAHRTVRAEPVRAEPGRAEPGRVYGPPGLTRRGTAA
ncbi:hypothetical protein [Streptomyces sp. NPDC002580]|uniref:hypothetical protein n=1 Tax=Streptomyces sp. NPDC002580 TaxID=3364653 RepID=UPI0036CD3ED5